MHGDVHGGSEKADGLGASTSVCGFTFRSSEATYENAFTIAINSVFFGLSSKKLLIVGSSTAYAPFIHSFSTLDAVERAHYA